ncbi:MAG: hypothetical protein KatS3mg104_0366 [Phycisphaerae bacterium]|nr:MAG: hypothetical protein KatS3mg104_0366 [Phycisphaerae bacterium]
MVREEDRRDLRLVRGLVGIWLAVLGIGWIVVTLPGVLGAQNQVSWERGVFTAINLSTQTGFSQGFARPQLFAGWVQFIFVIQGLTGFFLSVWGGGILLSRWLGLGHSVKDLGCASVAILVFSGLVGGLSIPAEQTWWEGFVKGWSALGGWGETIVVGGEDSARWVFGGGIPLGIFGAWGSVVWLELWNRLWKRQFISEHVLRVLGMTAWVYVLGTGLMLGLLDGLHSNRLMDFSRWVLSSVGMGNTSNYLSELPRGGDWIVFAIIVFGLGTVGTQGGIPLSWFNTLPRQYIEKIIVWIGVELVVMLVGLVILLRVEPALSADRGVGLVISSVFNVGHSHGAVSINGPGLLVLSGLMLFGRIVPLWVIGSWISEQNTSIRD